MTRYRRYVPLDPQVFSIQAVRAVEPMNELTIVDKTQSIARSFSVQMMTYLSRRQRAR